ncbi:MAG: hypothetical protein EOL95_10525 [Bacteroidia bacterium]|nr:hypothetical protein [Bacteroidia bacterium]
MKNIYTSFLQEQDKRKVSKAEKLQTSISDPSKTERLLTSVLEPLKTERLSEILNKFIILSSQENDEELYKILLQSKTHGIPSEKKIDYINSLMGYIISPPITSDTNKWEITYQDFKTKTESLHADYNSKTIIFPATYRSQMATEMEEKQYSEYTFVRKINEINYKEVKSNAISDLIYTRKILLEELSGYQISKIHYDNYEKEIHDTYISKYRTASLRTEHTKLIRDSKIFYNNVTGEDALAFRNFHDTPKRFRNGLLHQMADDDSESNPRKIIWKLKVEGNE